MIEMRRAQLSFGDGLIAEEVSDLRENWMKHGHSQNKHLMPFAACAFGAVFAVVDRALQQRAAQHPGGHGNGSWDAVSPKPRTRSQRSLHPPAPHRRGRCGPTWCTGTSPMSAAARHRMPRRWAVGAWRSGRRCSSSSCWRGEDSPRQGRKPLDDGCGWIRRWWRPTSIIRPTVLYWGTGFGC